MLRELLIIRGPVAVPVRANHQVIGLTFEPFGSKLQDVRLIGGEKRRRCAWAATLETITGKRGVSIASSAIVA